MKKGEFFIISIVLVVLSIMFLITFPQTAISSSELSNSLFENYVMEMISAKTSGRWHHYNFSSEIKVLTGYNESGEFNVSNIVFDPYNPHLCMEDIYVINESGQVVDYYVTEFSSPCDVIFEGKNSSTYYILYDNMYGFPLSAPLVNPGLLFNETYSKIYDRKQYFCDFIENYTNGLANVSCENLGGEKFELSYESKNLIYKGII